MTQNDDEFDNLRDRYSGLLKVLPNDAVGLRYLRATCEHHLDYSMDRDHSPALLRLTRTYLSIVNARLAKLIPQGRAVEPPMSAAPEAASEKPTFRLVVPRYEIIGDTEFAQVKISEAELSRFLRVSNAHNNHQTVGGSCVWFGPDARALAVCLYSADKETTYWIRRGFAPAGTEIVS